MAMPGGGNGGMSAWPGHMQQQQRQPPRSTKSRNRVIVLCTVVALIVIAGAAFVLVNRSGGPSLASRKKEFRAPQPVGAALVPAPEPLSDLAVDDAGVWTVSSSGGEPPSGQLDRVAGDKATTMATADFVAIDG